MPLGGGEGEVEEPVFLALLESKQGNQVISSTSNI